MKKYIRLLAIVGVCSVVGACSRTKEQQPQTSSTASGATEVAAPGSAAASAPARGGKAAGSAASAGEKMYRIQIDPPAEVAVGAEAKATITLAPLPPYKVNLEYPIKLALETSAGAKLDKAELGKADATALRKDELRLDPTFTLSTAGEHRFHGELRFSVCTETQCELAREPVSWAVRARP